MKRKVYVDTTHGAPKRYAVRDFKAPTEADKRYLRRRVAALAPKALPVYVDTSGKVRPKVEAVAVVKPKTVRLVDTTRGKPTVYRLPDFQTPKQEGMSLKAEHRDIQRLGKLALDPSSSVSRRLAAARKLARDYDVPEPERVFKARLKERSLTKEQRYDRETNRLYSKDYRGEKFQQAALAPDAILDPLTKIAKLPFQGVGKVLRETTRPVHAIAAATDDLVQGKSLGSAAKSGVRGAQLKDTRLFSDVLKSAGVKNKTVRTVGGFGLDVLADPLTWATFGTSGVAKAAAGKAGAAAARNAAKQGLDETAIRKVATAAAEKAAKGKTERKGLQVGMRLHAPFTDATWHPTTSGRATAKASEVLGLSKVATNIRNKGAVQGVARRLAPDFRQEGVEEGEHAAARVADRQLRGDSALADRKGAQVGRSIHRAAPKARREEVIAGVERAPHKGAEKVAPFDIEASAKSVRRNARKVRGERAAINPVLHTRPSAEAKRLDTVRRKMIRMADDRPNATTERVRPYDLGPELGPVAKNIGRINRELDEAERRAGVRKAALPFYFSHARRKNIEPEEAEKLIPQAQRKGRQFGADTKRTVPGTMREIIERAEAKGQDNPFSLDVGLVQGERVAKSGHRIARHEYVQKLAATGPRLDFVPGALPKGRRAYELVGGPGKQTSLKPLINETGQLDHKAVREAIKGRRPVHVLSEKLIEPRMESLSKAPPRSDPITARWKSLVLLSPGYHVGNLVGDTTLAWQAETSAKSFGQSIKATRATMKANKAAKSPEAARGLPHIEKMTVKIVGGKKVPVMDEIELAAKQGAIRTGLAGRELYELSRKEGGYLRRFGEHREDLPRFATWMSARKRGLSPEEASEFVNKHHIDYGDLSPTEEKIRTAGLIGIPFYTFFARNTRLQAEGLVKRPGKAANLQKLREEAMKAAGEDPATFNEKLNEWQERGAPLPIKLGKKALLFFPKSPIEQGISNFPKNPSDLGRNLLNRVGPAKLLAEIPTNYSFFFGEKIEDEQGKTALLPAPGWVGAAAEADPTGQLKKGLGLRKAVNGQWRWPGKVDYLAKSLPQTKLLFETTTDKANRHGVTSKQALLGFSGLKVAPFEKANTDLNSLYRRVEELSIKANELRLLGKDRNKAGTAYTPEYARVLKERGIATKRRDELRKKRGDKIAEHLTPPPKTPADEFEEFKSKSADPAAAARAEFERFKAAGR